MMRDSPTRQFFDPAASVQSELRSEPDEVWDVALICQNGHLVNDRSRGDPPHNADCCSTCGAHTIAACPGCREPIPGFYYHHRHHFGTASAPRGTPLGKIPQYCEACSRPFPWTERTMSAARALIRELATLDPYERDVLRRSIDHIVRETPQTPLAILRIRTALSHMDSDTAAALRELLLSVANDTVKQQLFS